MGLDSISNLDISTVVDFNSLRGALEVIKNGITSFGLEEHSEEGYHKIPIGTLANRPNFGYAGRLFFDTDGNDLYIDTGQQWLQVLDLNTTDIAYAISSIPSISNVDDALDRIFSIIGSNTYIEAGIVQYSLTSPKPVIGRSGTVQEGLVKLDDKLSSLLGSDITVTYGSVMTLQASLDDIHSDINNFKSSSGASSIGISYEESYHYLEESDDDVKKAIAKLDYSIYNQIDNLSLEATQVSDPSPHDFYGASSTLAVQLDLIGSALVNIKETVLIHCDSISPTAGEDSSEATYRVTYEVGVDNVTSLKVKRFNLYCDVSPSSDLVYKFKRGSDEVTLTVGSGEHYDEDLSTEWSVSKGDVIRINPQTLPTWGVSTRVSADCVLEITRSYKGA